MVSMLEKKAKAKERRVTRKVTVESLSGHRNPVDTRAPHLDLLFFRILIFNKKVDLSQVGCHLINNKVNLTMQVIPHKDLQVIIRINIQVVDRAIPVLKLVTRTLLNRLHHSLTISG